jgi:ABC-type sugar transport system ATPase subunit
VDAGEQSVLFTGIRKSYGPAVVLDVDQLSLPFGQVVGLVGENGAGKSTMMGSMAGSVRPEEGTIEIAGHRLHLGDTLQAQELGVAMVSQEFPLVGQLSVAENLSLGRRPSARRLMVDRRAMTEAAREMLARIGLDIPTRRRIDSLSVAQRQLIEIAKALGRHPLVLILDEPTSALGPAESEHVLELARGHARGGGLVIFVGHRLNEVRAVSDRIVVLRNGRKVADLTPQEATEERLVREMVGEELAAAEAVGTPGADGRIAFQARGLEAEGLGPLDLEVRAGEVVGVAGLMGSGRSRLMHVIMGARASTGGEMQLAGKTYLPHSASDGVAAGIGLVPEDRKVQALLVDAPIRWNVTLVALRQLAWRRLVIVGRNERRAASEIVKQARVRTRSIELPARSLSGGNQQRMIFGRWMAVRPKLLLLDEPTRGVDVGAKAEIYRLIEEERQAGMAILVVSSELEELLGICHRIVVLRRGRIAAELDRSEFSKERIIAAAAIEQGVA